MKQWEMNKVYEDDSRVRFFIGDVRDKERLTRALGGVDIVVHAAANKIVPIAEYNPFEAIKTNINGAMNLVDACLDSDVKRVIALSTDKASSPVNLYGATKLVSDKLFVSANAYAGETGTKFAVVRYGNVMGSRGSVIPFFLECKQSGILPITNTEMTRFNISLDDAIHMVLWAIENSEGGEIIVPKIPSYRIIDLANAISPECEKKIIGRRAGEKIHEEMISVSDSRSTVDLGKYYVILPFKQKGQKDQYCKKFGGTPTPPDWSYNSGSNSDFLNIADLKKLLCINK
jgi:UDP-N-acetylglucosamine 4,6-dehydratase (inverting)